GLGAGACQPAMQALEKDIHDFQVRALGSGEIATAFTVNDIQSTRTLFEGLGWHPAETRILYNHRRNRSERLKSFAGWLGRPPWHRVDIIGDRPHGRIPGTSYLSVKTVRDLVSQIQPGEKIFGCGNVAGLPLSLFI
ncbi:MAG: hypothetical protein MI747_20300, partial [Desulfobacterales bacterium]|nr:hypothetical protein [Desulfobacterales bacterium]